MHGPFSKLMGPPRIDAPVFVYDQDSCAPFSSRQHICLARYMLSPVCPSVRHTGVS